MKGISYITDDNDHKKAVVIDLKSIQKNGEEIHEFIDVLVADGDLDRVRRMLPYGRD